jgi:hypothetical protein
MEIHENSATELSGTSTANSLVLTSTAGITNTASADVTVTNNASFSGTSITLGNIGGDAMNFGSLTFNSGGAVEIHENSATELSGTSTANGLVLTSTAGITNTNSADVTVMNNASFSGTSIALGNVAGDTFGFGSLTFNSGSAVEIHEDSSTELTGTSSAGSLVLTSTAGITNTASADVTVTNNASFSGTSIALGNIAGDAMNFGSLTVTTTGSAEIHEDSSTTLAGSNVTGTFTLVSVGGISQTSAVTAGSLSASNSGSGHIALSTSANPIGVFAAGNTAAGGAVSVQFTGAGRSVGTVGSVSGITANNGNVTVNHATNNILTLTQDISSGGGAISFGTNTASLDITGARQINSGAGSITASRPINAATAGSGSLTFTAGAGNVTAGNIGSTRSLPTITVASAGNFNANAIGLSSGGALSLTTTGAGGAITGAISGTNATLTKFGVGIFTLNGANTYTGATAVDAGTLLVNGSTHSNSAVAVNSGGTLGGTGSVGGTVTVNSGGIINPGNGGTTIGTLTVGGLNFNGGTYLADFNGDTSDTIATAGAIDLANATAGSFSVNSVAGTASDSTVFVLIDNTAAGPIADVFGNVAEASTITLGSKSGVASYVGGTGANDFTITVAGTVTYTLPSSGDYTIQQVDIGGQDYLQILQGATVVDSRLAATVNDYVVTGTAGADTLNVKYNASGGYFQKNVTFNAGDGADTLNILGGSFGTVVYNYTNATDGNIQNFQNPGSGTLLNTITYTGLSPIANSGTATDMIFNLPAGGNPDATLADHATAGMMQLTGSTFENTAFAVPTGSLTINGGTGNDTISLAGADAAFSANVFVNGGAGTDAANVTGTFDAGAGNVTVGGNSDVETISINAGGLVTTGGVALTASGNVSIGANGINTTGGLGTVTLTSSSGGITVSGGGVQSKGTITFLAAGNISSGGTGVNNAGGSGDVSVTTTGGTLLVTDGGIQSAGNVTLSGSGQVTVQSGAVNNTDGTGTVSVTSSSGGISVTNVGVQSKGAITLLAAGDISSGGSGLNNASGSGDVAVTTTGGTLLVTDNGIQSAGDVTLSGSGQVTLQSGAVNNTAGTGTVSVTSSNGGISSTDGGVQSKGAITLLAAGDISSGGSGLNNAGGSGDVSVTTTGGTLLVTDNGIQSAGNVTLSASGQVTLQSNGVNNTAGTGTVSVTSSNGGISVSGLGVPSKGAITLLAAGDISSGGSGLNNASGSGDVAVTTTGGTVFVTDSGIQSAGSVTLSGSGQVTLQSGAVNNTAGTGTVSVTSSNGGISSTDGGVQSKGAITLLAAGSISSGGSGLNNAGGSGDVSVTTTGGTLLVTDGGIHSAGDVTLSASGQVTVQLNGVNNTAGTGTVSVTSSNGGISSTDGGVQSKGAITLLAAGNISSGGSGLNNASGSGDVAVTTTGGTLLVTDGGIQSAGNVTLSASGQVTVQLNGVNNTAGTGTVSVTSSNGGISITDGGVQSKGAITLTADLDVSLTNVNTLGMARVTSTSGAIVDAGGSTDITASSAALRAATGIGSDGNALETSIDTVAARTHSGDIHLANTGGLIVGTVDSLVGVTITDLLPTGASNPVENSGLDNITLTAASPIVVDDPIVNNDGGNIVLDNTGGGPDDITISANVTVTGGDAIVDGDGNIVVISSRAIFADSGAVLSTDAGGTTSLTALQRIAISGAAQITTVDGGITLLGNELGTTIGNFIGIVANNAVIQTTGAGDIELKGRGGNSDFTNYGVNLRGGTSVSSTASGATAGTITVDGTGGNGTHSNYGVYLTESTTVSSVDGAIAITGIGNGSEHNNYGVVADGIQTIQSTGTGADAATITIHGTGGNGTHNNNGVYLLGNTTDVSSVDGAILITGVGGNGSIHNNHGVYANHIETIQSTGTGAYAATITIHGTGGNGTNDNYGVYLNGNTTDVSSARGAIDITGIGNGTGTNNRGVYFHTGITMAVNATGTAAIDISGNGAGAASGVQIESPISSGTGNVTIDSVDDDIVFGAAGDITSTSGTVTVTADTDGDNGGAVFMANGALINAGSGPIAVSADGDATLGGLATSGAVTVTSVAGSVLDGGDSHSDIAAASAIIIAGSGTVGTGANALDTALQGPMATPGKLEGSSTGGFWLTNTGDLIIGGISATEGVSAGGNVVITANSALDVAEDVVSTGGLVLLTATDSVGGGDDLTVRSGVLVRSHTSTVELRAGDNMTLEDCSTVQAATTITLRGDYGDVDGSGSVMDLLGTLNAAAGDYKVLVYGGPNGDVITVNPGDSHSVDSTWIDGGGGDDTYHIYTERLNGGAEAATIDDTGGGNDRATVYATDVAENIYVLNNVDDQTLAQTGGFVNNVTKAKIVRYTGSLEHLTVRGEDGMDTFFVKPSQTTEITIHGGAPTFGPGGGDVPEVTPGDTLDFNSYDNTFLLICGTILTNDDLGREHPRRLPAGALSQHREHAADAVGRDDVAVRYGFDAGRNADGLHERAADDAVRFVRYARDTVRLGHSAERVRPRGGAVQFVVYRPAAGRALAQRFADVHGGRRERLVSGVDQDGRQEFRSRPVAGDARRHGPSADRRSGFAGRADRRPGVRDAGRGRDAGLDVREPGRRSVLGGEQHRDPAGRDPDVRLARGRCPADRGRSDGDGDLRLQRDAELVDHDRSAVGYAGRLLAGGDGDHPGGGRRSGRRGVPGGGRRGGRLQLYDRAAERGGDVAGAVHRGDGRAGQLLLGGFRGAGDPAVRFQFGRFADPDAGSGYSAGQSVGLHGRVANSAHFADGRLRLGDGVSTASTAGRWPVRVIRTCCATGRGAAARAISASSCRQGRTTT